MDSLCVKTHLLSGGGVGKVFINVCHTSGLPNPPKDVSDEELIKILASDEPTGFRVPMSIGEASEHPDKLRPAGNPSIVYDVAVSSDFFAKVETSPIFKSFLVSVVLEGVQNKYDITLDTEEVVILKNRKVMGTLRPHRVQQREVNTQGPLIQEVYPPINTSSSGSKIKPRQGSSAIERVDFAHPSPLQVEKLDTVLPTSQTVERKPEYRIICEPVEGEPQHLVGEFKLTDVLSSQELTLDVGEDRIVLEGRKKGYLIDVFVPYLIDQDNTSALFDTSTRLPTITTLPIRFTTVTRRTTLPILITAVTRQTCLPSRESRRQPKPTSFLRNKPLGSSRNYSSSSRHQIQMVHEHHDLP
uniref:PIH1 domain-containing protein 1 n=1 Tax=Timema douglasi TaxID=61478 RepID=A0A7R8VAU8_TIMDO|nr:unnamed protein product [Timema douglasi]